MRLQSCLAERKKYDAILRHLTHDMTLAAQKSWARRSTDIRLNGSRLSDYEIKKADRLLRRKEFLRLSQNGKQVHDRHFIIRFASNDVVRPRLGITVTKKVGNAVIRNRLKRFVREFFRLNRHRLDNHWDLVIIAKRPAAGLNSKQTFNLLAKLFDHIPGNVDD